MLQQTRVETVTSYFERFVARFPTPLALAEAPEDEVLGLWSGLGYYRRARLLQAGARAVAHSCARTVPATREELLELPGIGRYTAGAIASIAFGEPVGLVDGNVARVFARVFAIEADMKAEGLRVAERLAERVVAKERPGDWNLALMELGATVCTPRAPACDSCPVASVCRARAEGRSESLPVLSKKAPPKAQRMQALVVRRRVDGHVLLARRRSEGLFGGLWEPPAIAGGPSARAELLARFGVSPAGAQRVGVVTHVLSHRRLTIDVHVAELELSSRDVAAIDLPEPYEAAGLFDEAAIATGERGLATLARKVLGKARRTDRLRTRGTWKRE
jgi:A/G-specific adenine glycosylase